MELTQGQISEIISNYTSSSEGLRPLQKQYSLLIPLLKNRGQLTSLQTHPLQKLESYKKKSFMQYRYL
ncbi:hypothetical protein [Prevotella sp. HJM029]|uniref:hypothetical protein n=1 Tax=Prevotella sp. HJM029 TaxID=1433844 RepID=UPI0004906E43|nr:hypothetical protein [Prevotella sp. HJM029]